MQLGLADRVVLVTGGSSGIGAAAAVQFAEERARVAITYRTDEEAAQRTVQAIKEAGGEGMAVPLDLADHDSIVAALDAVTGEWGGIDVLVNNAVDWPAPSGWPPDFLAVPTRTWQQTVRTNLEGTIDLTQLAIPLMRGRAFGRIVLLSSGVVEFGMPGEEAYSAVKSGLHGFMRSLARELGPSGVLVNTVMPGLTTTERCLREMPAERRDFIARETPSGRLSTPADVAAAIVYLGSRANGNTTGEIVRVSGGL